MEEKEYLGVKKIKASKQVRSSDNQDGYQVTYEDGYVSWSPKDVFEKAYRRIDGLTFGLAIEALRQGKLIQRKGWNGKGMFVMKQIPAEIGLDTILKMQSVQQTAKDKLIKSGVTLKYENQMLIIKPDDTADSWVPSSSDVFAEDWIILD